MITYKVLPTSIKQGLIQFVHDVDQLRVAQGNLSKHSLINWFTKRSGDKQLDSSIVDTFTRTCAAWCVASYVIGVGDRHNDNILVHRQTGHIFHIDFGLLFGEAQKFAGVKRDRVPFVFTDAMAVLIAGGQEFGQDFAQAGYRQFVETCCLAFNLVRRRGESLLLSAVRTLRYPEKSLAYIRETLLLNLSDDAAAEAFEKMIDESLKSVAPQFNFFIHSLAMKFQHQEPTAPSTSNVTRTSSFSQETKLTLPPESLIFAEARHCRKVSYPVKYYLYEISVFSEQVSNLTSKSGDPLFIFRRYSEVLELRNYLLNEFPQLSQQLTGFKFKSQTENREVAKKRMAEINQFLAAVLQFSLEIKQTQKFRDFFTIRAIDLRLASGFESALSSQTKSEGQLWMTVTIRDPEAPKVEVIVHRGVNFYFNDDNCGRAKITLQILDTARSGNSTFSISEINGNGVKFCSDLAPPGTQPLFNRHFLWNLPSDFSTWPSDLSVVATCKVHPSNSDLLLNDEGATSSHLTRNLGSAHVCLTKMVSWATSWPIVDSQYFKLIH